MKVNIEGQGHFLTLVQGYLHIKIETCFSQKPQGHFQPNFVYIFLGYKEMKINQHDAGDMIKMAAMPKYCINTKKILLQGTR